MNCQKSLDLAYKIRLHALEMTSRGGTSHIASIFSMADLVAVLYADVLHYDPHNPRMPGRDRLLLSKGHAGAGIYAALAESGFFPVEELLTHCQNGSRLSGHVSHKGVPGVEASTGSLGQGMPMAMGMAVSNPRGCKNEVSLPLALSLYKELTLTISLLRVFLLLLRILPEGSS